VQSPDTPDTGAVDQPDELDEDNILMTRKLAEHKRPRGRRGVSSPKKSVGKNVQVTEDEKENKTSEARLNGQDCDMKNGMTLNNEGIGDPAVIDFQVSPTRNRGERMEGRSKLEQLFSSMKSSSSAADVTQASKSNSVRPTLRTCHSGPSLSISEHLEPKPGGLTRFSSVDSNSSEDSITDNNVVADSGVESDFPSAGISVMNVGRGVRIPGLMHQGYPGDSIMTSNGRDVDRLIGRAGRKQFIPNWEESKQNALRNVLNPRSQQTYLRKFSLITVLLCLIFAYSI